jgi:hypothetical protein
MKAETYIKRRDKEFCVIQWNGENSKEIIAFIGASCVVGIDYERKFIVLQSIGKKIVAEKGDFIFRSNISAFRPIVVMSESDFNSTFEKCNDKDND